jgi:2-C-methyl-D-erythritol 4-phosphate cytidylyltransferase
MGKLGVVVVAAGKGARMKSEVSKQFLPLRNKPILVHTLQVFDEIAEVAHIALVVSAADKERCAEYIQQYRLHNNYSIIAGGAERQDSVYKGLEALPADITDVMIQDGVRPFVAREKIIQCWKEAMIHGAAVLAVPVKDTIKAVGSDGCILSTPDRRSLWAIQTPQAFRLSLLRQAYEQARRDQFVGTDDSMLVERLGAAVRIVEGDYTNIKITTPEDLVWAECLLREKREGAVQGD